MHRVRVSVNNPAYQNGHVVNLDNGILDVNWSGYSPNYFPLLQLVLGDLRHYFLLTQPCFLLVSSGMLLEMALLTPRSSTAVYRQKTVQEIAQRFSQKKRKFLASNECKLLDRALDDLKNELKKGQINKIVAFGTGSLHQIQEKHWQRGDDKNDWMPNVTGLQIAAISFISHNLGGGFHCIVSLKNGYY